MSYGGNDGRTSCGDSTEGEEEDTEKPTICSQENLSPPTYSPVIINEVAWMGTTSSTDEWIELKNVTTSTVSLNEWQLIGTNTETNKIKIKIFFAERDTIASFYLLERDILSRSDDDPVPGITADKNFVGSINNEKFVLRLFNSECQLIDEVAANPNWPAGNKDKRRTMERDQDLAGWHTYCGDGENGIMGTPRKENSQPPLPQPILEISTTTLNFEAQEDGENPATTTLTIRNTGEAEMIWAVTTTYGTTTPTSTEWLSLQPTTGTLAVSSSTEIEFSVNISGLEAGNYQATATIEAAGAQNSPQKIQVKLAITEKETPSPETPSGIEVLPQELNFFMEVNGSPPPHQNLIIKNHTSEEVNWTISGRGYLKTTENSGVTPPKGISLIESWFYLHPDLQIEPGKTYSGTTTVSLKSEFLKKEIEIPVTLTVLPKTSRKVVINEIAWMGTQANYNDEWMELYNNTSGEIDLNGWVINWREGTTTRSINLVGSISAYGFYLLERTASTTISDIKEDQIYTGNLNNGGEKLELLDLNSNLIDEVDCSNGWFAGNNETKQTMERINPQGLGSDPNNWGTYNGTTSYGVDAKGNPIKGTPKQQNSVFQSEPPSPKIPSNFTCTTTNNTAILTWEISEDISEFSNKFLQHYFFWDIRYSKDNSITNSWEEAATTTPVINITSEGKLTTEIPDLYYGSKYYFGIKGFNGIESSNLITTSCEISPETPQWQMFGHDPQRTFRSPFIGPSTSTVKWQFTYFWNEEEPWPNTFETGPVIDQNGTIYIGASFPGSDHALHALLAIKEENREPQLKWLYETGAQFFGNPIIGPDGTIYTISGKDILAISPAGKLKWEFETTHSINSTLPSGENRLNLKDGILYLSASYRINGKVRPLLLAFTTEDGSLLWFFDLAEEKKYNNFEDVTSTENIQASPSFATVGKDGNIYVGFGPTIFAINSTSGEFQWKKTFEINPAKNWENELRWQALDSISQGEDETIYFIVKEASSTEFSYYTNLLYALKSNFITTSTVITSSETKWKPINIFDSEGPILIGKDGTLYLQGYNYYEVHGNSQHKYSLLRILNNGETTSTPLDYSFLPKFIDSENKIYGVKMSENYLVVLNSQGEEIWSTWPSIEKEKKFTLPFAISKNGTLYAPSSDTLYAFGL